MERLSGAALYNALYATTGYHHNMNTTRSAPLQPYLLNISAELKLQSWLDVGASNGFMVKWMWDQGLTASGCDISDEAVKLAIRLRGEPQMQCVGHCFKQAPATSLPFANRSFDGIVSSDVLEHVEPSDAERAIRELSRVASRALVLKIAARGDMVDGKQERLFNHRDNLTMHVNMSLPRDLHPTVHPSSWWISRFHAAGGWRLHKTIPHGHRYWLCCMFVLSR